MPEAARAVEVVVPEAARAVEVVVPEGARAVDAPRHHSTSGRSRWWMDGGLGVDGGWRMDGGRPWRFPRASA